MVGNGGAENITDKNVTLKWGDEDLEDSDKILLSQELNRLIKMFKVKVQQKDSKIEILLDKEIVHRAQIEASQSLLEQASQNNAQLSEEIENSNLEKRDLSKELLETRADLKGAENELELVKNESEQEIEHLRQELKEEKNKLEVAEVGHTLLKRESDEEKASLKKELKEARTDLEGARAELNVLKSENGKDKTNLEKELKETKAILKELILKKSESEEEMLSRLTLMENESAKERIRWEQEIITKEEIIESLASKIQMKSESINILQKQHCDASVDKENISEELVLSKIKLASTKQKLFEVTVEAEKRQHVVMDLENMIKDQVNMIERLKKDVQVKSDKVESQLKLIAEQQSKIKRFSENEEWFNLTTEEQNQKFKTLIQAKDAKLLESQKQLELLKTEKNSLFEKMSSFEAEVTNLQKRLDESELLHLKTLESKDGEVRQLNEQIEHMKIEIQLMEMNNETTETALENTKIANLELENKSEEHDNKVEISEDELKMLEEQFASLSPVSEDVKDDDDVTLIDMDLGSEKEEEVKEDDNSDESQSSTSKQRSEKDKRQSSTRTKRSLSCSPMGESRKQKRPDRTVEEKRRQASLERSPSMVIKVRFDRLGEGVQERVEEKKLCWVRSLKSQWERNLEGGKVEEQEMKSSANKKEMVKKKGWNFGKKK